AMTYGATTGNCAAGANTQDWCLAHSGLSQNVTFSLFHAPVGQIHERDISNSAYSYGISSGATTPYCPNGLNQYDKVGGSGSGCTGGTSYSSDARGNLTSDGSGTGSRAFTYDLENRLTAVAVSGGASVTLDYDPSGRMRQTTSSSAGIEYL